jgi:hypothetical protein
VIGHPDFSTLTPTPFLHLFNGVIPTMEKGDVVGHETMGEVVEVCIFSLNELADKCVRRVPRLHDKASHPRSETP